MKAVIFDKDGVLHDSTVHVQNAVKKFMVSYKVDHTEEEAREFIGKSFHQFLDYVNDRYDLDIKFEDMSRKVREYTIEGMGNSGANEGVLDLINELLDNGIKIAIASSNRKEFIMEDLGLIGLEGKFPVIVSCDDVEKHKPEPDVFLVAAEKLDVIPSDCVVIEDALAGVEAAKKAGMKVIALVTKFHKKEDFDADLVVDSLKDVNLERISKL
jgi:HAD superfamily hydrolase (TIGR01509 family)